MKILILDEDYPHDGNIIGDQFVHVRVKEYIKKHEVRVFAYCGTQRNLEYEGVNIEMFNNADKLTDAIKIFNPDKVLIHFYQSWMYEHVITKIMAPIIIWVHGYEALGWYRRLYNFSWYSPVLLNYIVKNTLQQYRLRKLIQYANKSNRIKFVFVSNWMRRITEFDTLTTIKTSIIIANPIDSKLFKFKKKDPESRKKILLLRSFRSYKYANDIAVNAILLLSKKHFFSNLEFTIIGEGNLFKKITGPLERFKNINLQERAVKHNLIPSLHDSHGIFLCPTRQDAQGVSMCEAMSSGLIPLTTNNTAIPEFVEDGHSGYLAKNAFELAAYLELLYYRPDLYQAMSQQASSSIQLKCSMEMIIMNELSLIEN
jgi:glycosyltransferase involved in cell wall biosynthesis